MDVGGYIFEEVFNDGADIFEEEGEDDEEEEDEEDQEDEED